MLQVHNPVCDVDLVTHQIGKDAASEVPEPAPLTELVLVEGLWFCGVPETPSNRQWQGRWCTAFAPIAIGCGFQVM
jgi:hypothetical protein